MKNMFLIFRSRILALPAKLSPKLATMGGQQAEIFDILRDELEEALSVLSDYKKLTEKQEMDQTLLDEEAAGQDAGG